MRACFLWSRVCSARCVATSTKCAISLLLVRASFVHKDMSLPGLKAILSQLLPGAPVTPQVVSTAFDHILASIKSDKASHCTMFLFIPHSARQLCLSRLIFLLRSSFALGLLLRSMVLLFVMPLFFTSMCGPFVDNSLMFSTHARESESVHLPSSLS